MVSRLIISLLLLILFQNLRAQEEVYELRTYQFEFFRSADVLHNYLEKALIPALNRQGIENVGVFEEVGEALPKKIYLLIPHSNIQGFQNSTDLLLKDQVYSESATPYLMSPENAIPFSDYTTNLIRSTYGFPNLVRPDVSSELFELRIYHSHNEDALRRKVKMFNDAEFPIFKDAGLPMVFFGMDIAGEHMPSLTYMLANKDKEANEKGWSAFLEHPEWKRITQIEEYANSVNDITRVFLKRLPYSQL
ncbi:NIPSNAP family containing protein [Robertkochia marina]|uniref:NIPSNAP family containing protein n=1 Tax=Robertkochia marina TaxID=1227945 RepID=A0A4S3M3C8_9FLAO|nr:NIPSNAP family protein [Robertkochia marina]THD68781.1 NIPSNAP family containing protein [Robertkochia marina]TRZ43854.1 NIPSNAP family containing protein [Robertkochia marina]